MQRVELALGIGQLLLGQRHVGGLFLARAIVGDLRLCHAILGAVQRRLGLDKRIVVLLALRIVQGIRNRLALRVGIGWIDRIAAGILHILPALRSGRVARLRLRQRGSRARQIQLGACFGGRIAIARVLEVGLRLADAELRGADVGRARVLQHRQIGLGRAQLGARAGDVAGARVALLLLLQLNLGRFELGLGGANIGLFRAILERAERRLGAL